MIYRIQAEVSWVGLAATDLADALRCAQELLTQRLASSKSQPTINIRVTHVEEQSR